jgi:hypothetical protein
MNLNYSSIHASSRSAVVEQPTHNPKVEGSKGGEKMQKQSCSILILDDAKRLMLTTLNEKGFDEKEAKLLGGMER